MAAKKKLSKRKQLRKAKSNPIQKLFEVRANTFNRGTKKIFKAIAGALEAINERMDIAATNKIGGELEWDDITLVHDDTRGVLILIGVIVYKPGSELTLDNGDKIKVTEDTAPYFRRLVRAGIPLEIAHKTKKQVLTFLKKKDDEEKKQSEDPVVDKEADFDLSTLTEEQRKLLKQSGTTTSKQ